MRPGTHSYGFVQTDFVSNHAEVIENNSVDDVVDYFVVVVVDDDDDDL